MGTHRFDLVVVGSGTGLDVANWAAESGRKVALVEKGPVGGTCLNRGCIPSKLLLHSADVMETIRRAPLFGIHVDGVRVDFPAIVKRVTDSVDGDSQGIEAALHRIDNPRLFQGEGRFVGPRRLRVGADELTADRFLLASGARPRIPAMAGLDSVPYMTSTEALRRTELPASMIIVGGGYIAAELAHFFGSLGTEITIIHRHPVLLNHGDPDIAKRFTEVYARRFRLILDAEPESVARRGKSVLLVARGKDGRATEVEAETLLLAAGLTPNSDTLDLAKTGVKTDARGYIQVNDHLETDAPGIFALGDAIGRFMLKHAANHEGPYAFRNMFEPKKRRPVDYHAMPWAVFASPQVAGVGPGEAEVEKAGTPYVVGTYRYRDTAMGHALEEEDGFVKFLVHAETGKILGCHIVGHEASAIIHEVVVAMKAGDGSIDNVTRAIHIHPALNEVVDRAAGSLRPPEHHAHV